MTAYTIILTIAVIGYIAFKVYIYFNKGSILNKAKEQNSKAGEDYENVLDTKIDVNNPGDGGMPGGQRVESINDL